MSIFDKLRAGNGAKSAVKSVVGALSNEKKTFTFAALPESLAQLQTLPEAAMDLGCTPRQAFFKVVLHEIMPGVISGALMAFTMSLDDFVISYFVYGPKFVTLPVEIYNYTKKPLQPKIYALFTLLFMVILLVMIVMTMLEARDEKQQKDQPIPLALCVQKPQLGDFLPGKKYLHQLHPKPLYQQKYRCRCSRNTHIAKQCTPNRAVGKSCGSFQ